MSESKMQIELFNLIRMRAKTSAAWNCIFSVPNGGLRDKGTAKKMYAEGVRAFGIFAYPFKRRSLRGCLLK
ncbi:MAG: hypothetical protein FWF51_09725 [Chitinivibrionia bacterium]|nr:hypothetical protein [Chitinivibrionia bacterium]